MKTYACMEQTAIVIAVLPSEFSDSKPMAPVSMDIKR